MANKKNASKKSSVKKVAPIKVEQIVDTPNSSKKEVLAIIIGILVVAALVVGSVVYFKGKNTDPLTKPKKDNEKVDVLQEPDENQKKKEKESDVVLVSNTVRKECTSCNVYALTKFKATDNKTGKKVKETKYSSKNDLTASIYYHDREDNTYIIQVNGFVEDTKADAEILDAINTINIVEKTFKKNKVTKEQIEESTGVIKSANAAKEKVQNEGIIAVTSKDAKVITHYFVIRIEEKEKVDWSKGVTVNGTTYTETIFDVEEPESEKVDKTFQDEDGINIFVGINEDDLGEDAKNEQIKFDVQYTTKEGNDVDNTYEMDIKGIEIKYEKETDIKEGTKNEKLGDEAITKEVIEEYVEEFEEEFKLIDQEVEAELNPVEPE